MTYELLRADARDLPLADESVDLIVTSPPYYALRSYQDGGEHFEGQIGSEATPQEYLEALWQVTAECKRVLKPSGSIFVDLGDKYSQRVQTRRSSHQPGIFPGKFKEFGESWKERREAGAVRMPKDNLVNGQPIREKSLMFLPERYRIGCVDRLDLIARAVIVWSKPNGLPESVTDRVRRSHEDWVHLTKEPRYFAAVDEVRQPHLRPANGAMFGGSRKGPRLNEQGRTTVGGNSYNALNPLGKLPGSVWTIPSEPLVVPEELGVEHFAAFCQEWPRRLILGWSPPDGVVLDPFCGTGTTVMVAHALGRHGIGVELSKDYLRLARWRIEESGHASKSLRRTWNERIEEPALFGEPA